MQTLKLTHQQNFRITELPENYRVVGIDRGAPVVRKPTGQILRVQQNGRLTAATTEAKCRLANRRADADLLADGLLARDPSEVP
jgi:hypothetical protein